MTISVLFGSGKAGMIGELQLDATIREVHTFINEVSQFPAEDGIDINDNIRQIPDRVDMSGFITNSPVNILQANNAEVIEQSEGEITIKNLKRTDVSNRVELAVDILLRISGRKIEGKRQDPQLVTIVSGLRVYHNMAMTSLTVPREAPSEQALRFEASFIEVTKVTSESVEIPFPIILSKDRASSTDDKGKQTAKTPKISTLRKFITSAQNFVAAKK